MPTSTRFQISRASLGLIALILAYGGLAALFWPHRYLAMLELYLHQLILAPWILIFGVSVGAIIMRPRSPLSFVREKVLPRLTILLAVMACVVVGMSAFTSFKLGIPEIVPFYADPYLAAFERALAGGQDPGTLLHELLPEWVAFPLGYMYGPVWLVLWLGTFGFVALWCDAQMRARYYWAMALTIIGLGTVLATALSSVGPVFYTRIYGGTDFSELARLIADSAVGNNMKFVSAYLLKAYQGGGEALGTGISAMPSMHVAVVTLNACLISHLNRKVGVVAWAYVGLIYIGSVYLSWHYVLDGVVSFVVVAVLWHYCARLPWRARQAAPPLSPALEPTAP